MDIREKLCEHYSDDLLFADGYDDAIIGVCGGFDSGRVAYSIPKMIEIAAKDLSVDHDEAVECADTLIERASQLSSDSNVQHAVGAVSVSSASALRRAISGFVISEEVASNS